MRKRVDLGTIADRVGVSKTTVHYALHQPGRLSAATLSKVLAAVEELGYRPNLLAQSLRTRRSHVLGVMCTRFDNSYFDPLYGVVGAEAKQNGYTVIAATSGGSAAAERELLSTACAGGIDGGIVLPVESAENRDFYRKLLEEELPVIFVQHSVPGVETDCVGTDDFLGGQLVARRLLEVGRRRVAFIPPPGAVAAAGWVCARRDGCNQTLVEAGLVPAGEADVAGDGDDLSFDRHGYESARQLLASGKDYDAIFAANDETAWGVLRAAAEAGRRVGGDLSVIGYDNLLADAYVSPALTSVRHPLDRIGREATRLLLARIEDPTRPATRLMLAPELVVRSSCLS